MKRPRPYGGGKLACLSGPWPATLSGWTLLWDKSSKCEGLPHVFRNSRQIVGAPDCAVSGVRAFADHVAIVAGRMVNWGG